LKILYSFFGGWRFCTDTCMVMVKGQWAGDQEAMLNNAGGADH
jgi:hypothetical protein